MPPPRPSARALRFGFAIAWGATSAAAIYAVLRVFQATTGARVDPALVSFHAHSAFFWRAWTSAYGGGTIAIIAWVLAAREPDRAARLLAKTIPIVAALALAQALLVP